MAGQGRTPFNEAAARSAGHAAGYCWAPRPGGDGRCTRPPDHGGEHVDYYHGRTRPTDAAGHRWSQ